MPPACPFHRARSASKKDTWPLPFPSFGGRAFIEQRKLRYRLALPCAFRPFVITEQT
jgi:hypothetical protein